MYMPPSAHASTTAAPRCMFMSVCPTAAAAAAAGGAPNLWLCLHDGVAADDLDGLVAQHILKVVQQLLGLGVSVVGGEKGGGQVRSSSLCSNRGMPAGRVPGPVLPPYLTIPSRRCTTCPACWPHTCPSLPLHVSHPNCASAPGPCFCHLSAPLPTTHPTSHPPPPTPTPLAPTINCPLPLTCQLPKSGSASP